MGRSAIALWYSQDCQSWYFFDLGRAHLFATTNDRTKPMQLQTLLGAVVHSRRRDHISRAIRAVARSSARCCLGDVISHDSTHGLQRGDAGRCQGARGRLRPHMQSGLPKTLVDLVYLRVSQINGCAYCIDMHSRDLLKEGVTVEKLRARGARLGGDGDARCRNGGARCRV
jgi:AhpD family alkylhydroperoxidase